MGTAARSWEPSTGDFILQCPSLGALTRPRSPREERPIPAAVPARAWVTVAAGTAVNLCLGILYGWSVWKAALVGTAAHPPGEAMTGVNAGWHYLTNTQATAAYAVCGLTFAVCMVPGGRLQDRFGPKLGATVGGLCLAAGCVVAGLMKSYAGLLLGFGLLGGVGMGFGYAATTPAAVKWFGPHRRGLVVGLVVGGYGGAAVYIAPLAEWLLGRYGLSGSFLALGGLFAVVVVAAGQLLNVPPPGYVPPAPPVASPVAAVRTDWTPGEVLRTPQFYALLLMFLGSAQSGILVIANAKTLLNDTATVAGSAAFFAANAWLLASFGGGVNAAGRIGTGRYSDWLGRGPAFALNGTLAAVALVALPSVLHAGHVGLLFPLVGVVFWQYGGGLALLPAFTADFFGSKHLGVNYGLVFLGWGLAFLVPLLAGYWKDHAGTLDAAFYASAGLLAAAVVLARFVRPPRPLGVQ